MNDAARDFAKWSAAVLAVSAVAAALDQFYASRAAWAFAFAILIGVIAARDPGLESLTKLRAAIWGS